MSSRAWFRAVSTFVALLSLAFHVICQDDDEPTSSASQRSSPFIDPLTSMPMERFFGARTQFAFSMALPLASIASSSFIGQLSFPLVAGAGWGAMGLTGDMEGNFFLAVWPDGAGNVVASFRQGIDEDNPPEVRGNFAVRPIQGGVSVTNTQLTYTFLCEDCLNSTLGLGPEGTVGDAVMGWALSERAVRDPMNQAAFLGFHERGFGPFTARLAEARTASFEQFSALAGLPEPDSGAAIPALPNIFGEGDDGDDDDDDSVGGAVQPGNGNAVGIPIGQGSTATDNRASSGASQLDDDDDFDDDDD